MRRLVVLILRLSQRKRKLPYIQAYSQASVILPTIYYDGIFEKWTLKVPFGQLR